MSDKSTKKKTDKTINKSEMWKLFDQEVNEYDENHISIKDTFDSEQSKISSKSS